MLHVWLRGVRLVDILYPVCSRIRQTHFPRLPWWGCRGRLRWGRAHCVISPLVFLAAEYVSFVLPLIHVHLFLFSCLFLDVTSCTPCYLGTVVTSTHLNAF